MSVSDKSGVLQRLDRGERIALELGCGARKRHRDAVGVDREDHPGVDIIGDVLEVLRYLPNACVEAVHAYHFLEHIGDIDALLGELARVMTQGAHLDAEVPHFSNPYFYSDPTHHRFFGLYSFCYLADSTLFRRQVPTYAKRREFTLIDVQLEFDSPFPIRARLRRAAGWVFNRTRWLQEFHEENLCWLLPCYQLRFELRRQ